MNKWKYFLLFVLISKKKNVYFVRFLLVNSCKFDCDTTETKKKQMHLFLDLN